MAENNMVIEGGIHKRKKIYLLGSLIFVFLLIVGAIVYPLLSPKPKTIFTMLLNDVYSFAKQEEQPNILNFNMDVAMNLASPHQEDVIFEILNAITFDIHYALSFPEKRLHMQFDSKYQEKDLLNLSMDMEEENAYLYLQDLYPNYLKIPVEGIQDLFSINSNQEDTKIVLESIKNALPKTFKDDYFTQEKETILLNGKTVKATKNNLILNKSNLNEILKSLAKELDNDTFITSLARLQNIQEKDIKNYLERMKNNADSFTEEITFSIYTKGLQNEFIGISIYDRSSTFSIFKNTETNYDFEIKMNAKRFSGNVDISKHEQQNYTFVISLDTDIANGSITLNLTYKEEETIPKIDRTNAIAIEDLSEEAQNLIGNNFQNKEGMVKLIQDFISPYMFNMDI